MNGVALVKEHFGIDLSRDPVAHFEVYGIAGVDKITVERSPHGPKPFRALQYHKKHQYENGEYWLDECDEYVYNRQLERQILDNTDMPLKDIQLEKEPIETYGYSTHE